MSQKMKAEKAVLGLIFPAFGGKQKERKGDFPK